MSLRKRNVYQPNTTTSFIAFEVGVVVVKEGEYRRHDDRHALPIRPCACFKIHAEGLFCSLVSVYVRGDAMPSAPYRRLNCNSSHKS